MDNRGQRPPSALRNILIAVAALIFLAALVQTTVSFYSKTSDAYLLRPDNILVGRSEAPNQYRVLVPLLSYALWHTGRFDAKSSDRVLILVSIVLCYLAAGALFYKSSGSLIATMLALIALLGSLSFGMVWKYRQEFFDLAFVSAFFLILIAARPRAWTFVVLALITALATLNRESFVFCITGMAAHLWSRSDGTNGRRAFLGDTVRVVGLLLVFAAVFATVRYHFGLSRYHGGLWMFRGNISNLLAFLTPHDALYMGAGVLFVYVTTLLLGNREYLPFIAGYAIPMLLVAFFIARYNEHRIFYPLIVLLIASIIKFMAKKKIAPGDR